MWSPTSLGDHFPTRIRKDVSGGLLHYFLLPFSTSSISADLQQVLDNHSKVFETPEGLPPIHDHDHAIHLIPGSVPPNIRSYRYPYAQMLEAGIIQPSQSSFSTLVVLVHKKDGLWHMCLNYRELSKATIKDKLGRSCD